MKIGTKLPLSILAVFFSGIIAVGVYSAGQLRLERMDVEVQQLERMRTLLAEESGMLLEFFIHPFDLAIRKYTEHSEVFEETVLELQNITHLRNDSEIAEFLDIISGLYSLLQGRRQNLFEKFDVLMASLEDIEFVALSVSIREVYQNYTISQHSNREQIYTHTNELGSQIEVLQNSLLSSITAIDDQNDKIIMAFNQIALRSLVFAIACGVAFTSVGLFFALRTVTNISRRLHTITGQVSQMAQGELVVDILDNSTDEIGELGSHFSDFKEQLGSSIRILQSTSHKTVDGRNRLQQAVESARASVSESRKSIEVYLIS